MKNAFLRYATVLAAVTLLGKSDVALAKVWEVDPGASEVEFQYQRDGEPAIGYFRAFAGNGQFEIDAPDSAELEIRIHATSIDLLDPLASAFANSSEWFDTKNHPEIVYRLSKLTQISPGLFAAEGNLTVRGKTKRIASEIALDVASDSASAEGTLKIRRSDFGLGIGLSTALVEIGPFVTVRFRLAGSSKQ